MSGQKNNHFEEFQIDVDEPIYTTGVICRLLEIPVHILKQLDEEDVVKPPRKKGKARLYSKRELKKIQRCWFYLQEKKVNVEGLKIILAMEEEER